MRLSTFLMAAGLVALQSSMALAEVKLTFVGFAPPNTGSEAIPNWWMDQVEERSKGEIKFRRFPVNQLCKGPEIVECVRDGRADLGAVPQSYTPALFPISMIDGLPYVSSDQSAINRGLAELYQSSPEFRNEHEKLGLHLQLYWAADPLLIGTNFPVNSPADLKGKRLRAVGYGPAALATALEAQPVALATAEQYEAMRTGVLDGFTSSFEGAIGQKLQEVSTQWIDPGVGVYATVGLWLSDAAWKKLSPEQQTIVNEVTAELIAGKAQEIHHAYLEGFCDKLKNNGSVKSLVAWSEDQIAPVREKAIADAYAHWAEGVARAGVADPKAYYDNYVGIVKAAEGNNLTIAQECIPHF